MTRSTFPLVVCVTIAWYLSLGLGCSRSDFTLAPVSCMITMDGHPLGAAYVGFQPVGGDVDNPVGPGSYGQSDEDGRFVLHTIDDDSRGAVVGTHRVSIYAGNKVAKTEYSTEEASGSAERDLAQHGERRKRRKMAPRGSATVR